MKTLYVKPQQATHDWLLIDAADQPLGRVAERVAYYLRGKHKPCYVPYHDLGDRVIVINAAKAKLTGAKASQKLYRRHSGYPGGLSSEVYEKLVRRLPTRPMEEAIRGMLPKGPLGRELFRKLRVYAGAEHGHAGQQPRVVDLNRVQGGA